MRYNFVEQVNQVESSVKWGMTENYFGVKDLIPMWVAEMDLRGPQPVVDALKKRAEVAYMVILPAQILCLRRLEVGSQESGTGFVFRQV